MKILSTTHCSACYPIIRDEFQNLSVSKQRKSQLRRRKRDLCTYCDAPPSGTRELCPVHRESQNARRRVS
jgi:hypothetical protein